MNTGFMKGINLTPYYARGMFDELQQFLKRTGIEWVRIHTLPTRHLEEGWLRAVDQVCAHGYNIIVPIDVGTVDNVGLIRPESLNDFVEESYDWSYSAAKLISGVAEARGCEVIFGVENEIDVKEWVLQGVVGWRGDSSAWAQLALDYEMKYRRLNNILRGIRKAKPGARTMTNVEADDLDSYLPKQRRQFRGVVKATLEMVGQPSTGLQEIADWKMELGRVKHKLGVDVVGLDNYPNYMIKLTLRGDEIGGKVDEAARLTGKPVVNCEFGFSTYRDSSQRILLPLLGRRHANQDQLTFFKKALDSIRSSKSVGTFPWVSVTQPYMHSTPPEEDGFGLIKLDIHARAIAEPSLEYYESWLGEKQNSI